MITKPLTSPWSTLREINYFAARDAEGVVENFNNGLGWASRDFYGRKTRQDALSRLILISRNHLELPYDPEISLTDAAESVWTKIRDFPDTKIRNKLIKEFSKQVGGDVVLAHLFELSLSEEEEKDILVNIVKNDPEAFSHNLQTIGLEQLSYRDELVSAFFETRPDLFVYHLDELILSRAQQENYLSRVAEDYPEIFVKVYESLASAHKWSKEALKGWREKVEQKIKTWSAKPAVEILEVTRDLASISPEIDETIRSLRAEAFTRFSDELSPKTELIRQPYLGLAVLDYGDVSKMMSDFESLAVSTFTNEQDRVVFSLLEIIKSTPDFEDLWDVLTSLERERKMAALPAGDRQFLLQKFIEKYGITKVDFSELNPLLGSTKEVGDQQFYRDLVDQLFLNHDSVSNIFAVLRAANFDSKTRNEILDRMIAEFADVIMELTFTYTGKIFNDDQVERLIKKQFETTPYDVMRLLGEHGFRNKSREREALRWLINQKKEPFSWFSNVDDLRFVAVHEIYTSYWSAKSPQEQEEVRKKLEALFAFRERVGKKVWDALTPPEGYEKDFSRVLLNCSAENLEALEWLIETDPKWLEKISVNHELMDGLRFLDRNTVRAFYDWYKSQEKFWPHRRKKEKDKKFKVSSNEVGLEILALRTKRNFEDIRRESDALLKNLPSLKYEINGNSLLRFNKPERAYQFVLEHGVELEVFLKEHVVRNDYEIRNVILKDPHPLEKFEFLKRFADVLDFGGSEAERLATISSELVLKTEGFFKTKLEGLKVRDRFDQEIDLGGLPEAELISLISERLAEVLSYDASLIQGANERNRLLAEAASEPDNFELPQGTLLHVSSTESVEAILASANLCGECIGLSSKDDSYPFFVDTTQVGNAWESRKGKDIFQDTKKLYGDTGVVYVYPFRGREKAHRVGQEIEAPGSSYAGHRLMFAGIPNHELGALVYLTPRKSSSKDETSPEAEIESLKQVVVQNDMYIPIFDRQGVLLFTYDEFFERWSNGKKYGSFSELLDDKTYLEGLDVPQAAAIHEYTLQKHLLIAEEEVSKLAEAESLGSDWQQLLRVAARLHDLGKHADGDKPQEIVNVEVAETFLQQIRFLDPEKKRAILMLIRHDELLGEILQGTELRVDGSAQMSDYAKEKFSRFEEIFRNSEMRAALLCLYRADVKAIGNKMYQEWQVDEKLRALKLIS